MAPEAAGPGYWAGAPSLVVDGSAVWLSYRRRRPRDGSPDERGHLAAVAVSTDAGKSFRDVWALTKHEVGTSSLERFCLRRRQGTGAGWALYTSWEDPPASGRWRIDVMSAPSPDRFSLECLQPVFTPDDVGVDAVKDPYVCERGGQLLMFVSTFLTPAGPAPTSVATSRGDGGWAWQGEAFGVGQGWDAYQARVSSVLRVEGGWVAYYDGAASPADDTEEHCGLAVTTDLRAWRRLTEEGPALVSRHATGSLRYVEVVQIGPTRYAYYEYARPDGSHELRRSLLTG